MNPDAMFAKESALTSPPGFEAVQLRASKQLALRDVAVILWDEQPKAKPYTAAAAGGDSAAQRASALPRTL